MIFQIIGIFFFSYIMAKLYDIMVNYKSKMGIVDKTEELTKWIRLLQIYDGNDLPLSLSIMIEKDIKFFWANDRTRNSEIIYQPDHLMIPHDIRGPLVVDYLYYDIYT